MCVRGSGTSNGRRQHAWATCRRRNRPSGSKKKKTTLRAPSLLSMADAAAAGTMGTDGPDTAYGASIGAPDAPPEQADAVR